jgi:hypothetical protein
VLHTDLVPSLASNIVQVKAVYFAGIGRDLALKLAACGGEVYGVSRTAEHLQSLKVNYLTM